MGEGQGSRGRRISSAPAAKVKNSSRTYLSSIQPRLWNLQRLGKESEGLIVDTRGVPSEKGANGGGAAARVRRTYRGARGSARGSSR